MPAFGDRMKRSLQTQRPQVARKPVAAIWWDGQGGLEWHVEPVKADDEILVVRYADGCVLDGREPDVAVKTVVNILGRRA